MVLSDRFASFVGAVRSAPARWSYPFVAARDRRLDLLRGMCVFFMIIAHLTNFGIRPIMIGIKYLLVAEFFVVISGMLLGTTGRQYLATFGLRVTAGKFLGRSMVLYLCLIGMSVCSVILGTVFDMPWLEELGQLSPAELVWNLLTLQLSFYMAGLFIMYVVFTASAPLALWLLSHRLWWLLLLCSWAGWLLYQVVPAAQLPMPRITTFHPLPWQLFFYHALVFGYYQREIGQVLTAKRQLLRGVCGFFGTILVALGIGFTIEMVTPLQIIPYDGWFEKFPVRFGRVLLTFGTFPGLLVLATYCWQPINRMAGWLLLPLGRHALLAFALHLPLLAVMSILDAAFGGLIWNTRLLRYIVPLTSLILIWWVVAWKSQQQPESTGEIVVPASMR